MSYFCRSRNTILCSRLPYAVAHSLFFASHPRCSLVPEAVSHRGRIYTVVLGRVPRNRKHLEARGSSRDPSPKGHVVFHRRRSRRSYARQKRTPRPEHKYFLFSRGLTAGTLLGARSESAGCQASMLDVDARYGSEPVHWPFRQLENVLALQK